MSCCGSPPHSTRYRRMSWRAPSSPPPPVAGLRWRCRRRPGGARLRPGGDRRQSPGQARQGHVDRRRRAAAVGAPGVPRPARHLDGSLTVFAAVDEEPAGAFLLQDPIRPDAPRMVRALRDRRHVTRASWSPATARTSRTWSGASWAPTPCWPGPRPRGQAHRDRTRVGARCDDHGRGRGQRRSRARGGRRWGGPRRARGHRVIRGGRRRSHGRPDRRPGRRDAHRAPLEADRPAGRPHRHGPVARRDDRRRGRAPAAGGGRDPARGHRRAGDRYRAARRAARRGPHDRDAARRRRHRAPAARRA